MVYLYLCASSIGAHMSAVFSGYIDCSGLGVTLTEVVTLTVVV